MCSDSRIASETMTICNKLTCSGGTRSHAAFMADRMPPTGSNTTAAAPWPDAPRACYTSHHNQHMKHQASHSVVLTCSGGTRPRAAFMAERTPPKGSNTPRALRHTTSSPSRMTASPGSARTTCRQINTWATSHGCNDKHAGLAPHHQLAVKDDCITRVSEDHLQAKCVLSDYAWHCSI